MTKLVTILFVVIPVGAFIMDGQKGFQNAIGIALIFAVVYGACYALIPNRYIITDAGKLVIRGVFTVKTIDLNYVRQVTLITAGPLPWFRLFGIGGFFGYTGLFYNRQWGRFYLFGRRRSGTFVALELNNQRVIVLAPDDPIALMDALNSR